MVKNGQKWPKMAKIWSKMAKSGQIWKSQNLKIGKIWQKSTKSKNLAKISKI
jgi:hypothetical protein